MQRFFIDPSLLRQPYATLPEAVSRQLALVLRAKVGEHIGLLDDTGIEYEAEITAVSPREISVHIVSSSSPETEPHISVTLYQALVKEAKMDLILQKGTELGARRFVPLLCERSLQESPSPARYTRWRRIITEAAEQSGRTRLPLLEPPVRFSTATRSDSALRLIASPGQAVSLRSVLSDSPAGDISLYIGPEGGFSGSEIETAIMQGITAFSLGKRILRTETAGLAALTVIMAAYGEM